MLHITQELEKRALGYSFFRRALATHLYSRIRKPLLRFEDRWLTAVSKLTCALLKEIPHGRILDDET